MRIAVSYRGRVQGVGFRATARGIARGLPITGWVRNVHDGSVQLEAQGAEGDLKEFRRRLTDAMSVLVESEDAVTMPDAAGETGFVISH